MSHLVDPDPDYPSDSEEEEGEEEEEEEQQQPPIDDTPRKKSRIFCLVQASNRAVT